MVAQPRGRRHRRLGRIAWIAALAVILTSALLLWRPWSTPEQPIPKTLHPQPGSLQVGVAAPGLTTLPVSAQVNLAAREAGQIVSIAKLGSQVKAGQVLVRFGTALLTNALDQAKAAWAGGESQLHHDQVAGQLARSQAQEEVDAAKTSVAGALTTWQADRAKVRADRTLLKIGAIPKAQLNGDSSALAAAAAALEGARAQLAQARAVAASTGPSWNSALESDQLAVKREELQVQAAQDALDRAELASPIAGTVIAVDHQVGDVVGMSAPLLTVANLKVARFSAQVAESDIAEVQVGQSAQISVSGIPGTLKGRVLELSPAALNQNNVAYFPVTLSLAGSPSQLRAIHPGMSGAAQIEIARVRHALLLPIGAFRRIGKKTGTLTVDLRGNLRKQRVAVGPNNGSQIVVEGLSPSAQVVPPSTYRNSPRRTTGPSAGLLRLAPARGRK
jgi:multidrug resistance efflux pump